MPCHVFRRGCISRGSTVDNRRFDISKTPLRGVKVIRRQRIGDSRGFLCRLFCVEELALAGWTKPISQINHTLTAKRGTIRGLHYQLPPHAEMKLVTCTRGEVWDVAVDLRRDSPTFLSRHAEHLSADNQTALLIPEGCAHGFQALTDDAELVYLHSEPYVPGSERGVNPFATRLALPWPEDVTEMSPRDRGLPEIDPNFQGIEA